MCVHQRTHAVLPGVMGSAQQAGPAPLHVPAPPHAPIPIPIPIPVPIPIPILIPIPTPTPAGLMAAAAAPRSRCGSPGGGGVGRSRGPGRLPPSPPGKPPGSYLRWVSAPHPPGQEQPWTTAKTREKRSPRGAPHAGLGTEPFCSPSRSPSSAPQGERGRGREKGEESGQGKGPEGLEGAPRGVCSGWGQKALSRRGHGEENKAGDLLPLARAKPWGLASRGPAATSRAAPGLPFLLQASPSPP